MSVLSDLDRFYANFNGEKFSIGKSMQGRDLLCFKVSKTLKPVIIVQASIHAREFVTAYLTFKLIKDFSKNGRVGTVYFIPVMNPDGVNICQTVNPLYKANARGVDLNVNFDARWGKGEKNVWCSGLENFVGDYPFSELETMSLRDFTYKIKPDMTISYHSKGEEIYYEFFQSEKNRNRDRIFAELVAKITGYAIKSTPFSAGGYKDWCIEKLGIPALTIEVGNDSLVHPLGKRQACVIFQKHKGVISALTEKISEYQIQIHEECH